MVKWSQRYWKSLKTKKLFWTLFIVFIIFDLFLIYYTYEATGYHSQANALFSVEYGTIPIDYGDEILNRPVRIDVILKFRTEGGPFTTDRPFYPYELEAQNNPVIPWDFEITKLNLTFYIYTPERIDWSESKVRVNLSEVEYHNGFVISLPEGEHGQFTVSTSGVKQLYLHSEITITNESESEWFEGRSEDDSYNLIEIEPIEKYQDYLRNRFTIVAIVVSAVTVSIPATAKTIRDLYRG